MKELGDQIRFLKTNDAASVSQTRKAYKKASAHYPEATRINNLNYVLVDGRVVTGRSVTLLDLSKGLMA